VAEPEYGIFLPIGNGGRIMSTYTMMNVVMDDTDEAAWERVALYQSGADREAIGKLASNYARHDRADVDKIAERFVQSGGFQTERIVGSHDTVATALDELVGNTRIDGVRSVFPDYHAALDAFGEAVLPQLRPSQRVDA
jgi:pyrimidine oxygenase